MQIQNLFWMHRQSGAHFGPLFFQNTTSMEHRDQRLETLSPKRQEQFQKILKHKMDSFSDSTEKTREEVIESAKVQMLYYLGNEQKEEFIPRKQRSKGKKHREKWPEQIQRILEKLGNNEVQYPALFQEIFGITLKEKNSHKGISYIWLCPFHEEKTPSLSISPARKYVKCFGCGTAGSIIEFIKKAWDKKYSTAVGMLEKYICTPAETEEWRKRNTVVIESKKISPEHEEKKEFVKSLSSGEYLPKKQFEAQFAQRKKEKTAKDNEISHNDEDELPF
ncbi:MAG: hypothetical protein ACD_80C00181G0003 [uncultured bacterium (gcode 4)]|uniref:Zinc finger CHC2-type domain-containing protein n=1 Tax=uncultured bacterium (gcode 4) TaxID=1234023 RepID=K1XHS4_9BACT|nr:MAG: hypothetical protein ACD_80C00181G0003 [uncultured bacterium (gcode 4)]